MTSQAEPDGSFPTVRFPNPEEPDALAELIALARERDAPVAFANDPDADRLAVIARTAKGDYEALSGNEIGCLLAAYLLERGDTDEARVVINTVVSSPLLGSIAAAHGATFAQTLTGHKWIHDRAIEEEREGKRFIFGYEEAIGFSVGSTVRDKDGISALLVFAELAAEAEAAGQSVLARRDAMFARYGTYASLQRSLVRSGREGAAEIEALMTSARSLDLSELGGVAVAARVDGEMQTRIFPDGTQEVLSWVPTPLVIFELEGGHRAMMRPSGTEPKLKFYVDARDDNHDVSVARESAESLAESILGDLFAALQLGK